MKKNYFKVIFLLIFSILSFGIFAETQEKFDEVTIRELRELKVNEESIKKTMEALMWQVVDRSKTEKLMQEAIKLDDKNYLAYFVIGSGARMYEKNTDKALEYYEKAIKANPKNPRAYNNSVIAYEIKGDTKKAEEIRQQMIKLFPDYPETYYSLGQKYYDEKNYDKSIENYEKAIIKYENIKELNYWYITDDKKSQYIMDAKMMVIYSYVNKNELSQAINYFVYKAYPDMKEKEYPYLKEIFSTLAYENQKLYKGKDDKEYEKNLKNLENAEVVRVLIIQLDKALKEFDKKN